MFLEKLEIQGFKSFANKNILVFPGMLDKTRRGITAVVGPNGSGKSNIADSIRWVLGEQSMKTLRGKKSEDVIFSGSDKKGKLGMAEVSLYLNNEDGSAPIEYSQVVLTRRLYRDGASEYLINNAHARLTDIQIMLAKAKFGQRTYSVIGQGMVEGFLNTSLSERKEFFDEATGVKEFQIKRDDALNKLRGSYENMNQAQMLLSEIEPRLKSLTRQVNRLQRKGEIETELKEIQRAYYAKNWHEINSKFNEYNGRFLELEKEKMEKDKKLEGLNRRLDQAERDNEVNQEFNDWQKNLAALSDRREIINKQLARLEAQLELKLESAGHFDLSWLTGKKSEVKSELLRLEEEAIRLKNDIAGEKSKLSALMADQEELMRQSKEFAALVEKYGIAGEAKKIEEQSQLLEELLGRLESLVEIEDIVIIREVLGGVRQELRKLIDASSDLHRNENLKAAQEKLEILAREKESKLDSINQTRLSASTAEERLRMLVQREEQLRRELKDIEEKVKRSESRVDDKEIKAEQDKLSSELKKTEEDIAGLREKIGSYSQKMQAKQSALIELQKEIQSLQNEINFLTNQLNELKISSTRYETRLEDLEREIRQELGGLKEVRAMDVPGEMDMEAAQEKIGHLKRQIESIGGIDPEVEKEYIETKERFDFLEAQTTDLTSAIDSLEDIIKELDAVIKERFDKEFKLISEKFEEYFKILFNGGNARIVKVLADEMKDEDDVSTEPEAANGNVEAKNDQTQVLKKIKYLQKYNATGLAGVEIQATPPGKKIRSISMLSGGERALTAIALICAIISANPSPFVVLDEVDAALDEANSERLAKILDDLSHKTQFIVVTHNRASMRRANILYGVTMMDDGVSKLLSVKLDEVQVGRE